MTGLFTTSPLACILLLLSDDGCSPSIEKGKSMRATIMYGAGDVRVENVPDPSIIEPTDAVLRVVRACICGSDL